MRQVNDDGLHSGQCNKKRLQELQQPIHSDVRNVSVSCLSHCPLSSLYSRSHFNRRMQSQLPWHRSMHLHRSTHALHDAWLCMHACCRLPSQRRQRRHTTQSNRMAVAIVQANSLRVHAHHLHTPCTLKLVGHACVTDNSNVDQRKRKHADLEDACMLIISKHTMQLLTMPLLANG